MANPVTSRPAPASVYTRIASRIVPIIFILYLVAFLDRVNIGFAALTMNGDLGITSAQFGLVTGVFFGGYFLFEIPSNLLLHRIGARIWIARSLISWGIVTMLTGAVRSVPHLYIARFLLGAAEAGFFPGIVRHSHYSPSRHATPVGRLLRPSKSCPRSMEPDCRWWSSYIGREFG